MEEGKKFFEKIVAKPKTGGRVLDSEELFRGSREIVIQHGDRQYRLLVTKSGKLILNK